MNLFQNSAFILSSGMQSNFKIECDVLTDDDWQTLAVIISNNFKFSQVIGVPTGGIKLANKLCDFCSHGPILVVDDVLTTGRHMEEVRANLDRCGKDYIGVVVFSRGKCPDWITPIFQSMVRL